MSTVHKTFVVGYLGQDPEVATAADGLSIVTFSVATDDKWTDKQTGERKTHTEWHRIKCYARLAEAAAEFLQQGSFVYVEGRNRTQKWTDDEGIARWTTFIKADEIRFLGNTRKNSAPDSASDSET